MLETMYNASFANEEKRNLYNVVNNVLELDNLLTKSNSLTKKLKQYNTFNGILFLHIKKHLTKVRCNKQNW